MEIQFTNHKSCPFKVHSPSGFLHSYRTVQPPPVLNFRTFSTPQKKALAVTPISLLSPWKRLIYFLSVDLHILGAAYKWSHTIHDLSIHYFIFSYANPYYFSLLLALGLVSAPLLVSYSARLLT